MSESIGVSFDGKGINMSVSFEKGVSTEVEFPQGGGKVDLSGVAQQGDDPEATNTAIFNAVKSIPDLSLLYAARAEKNDDGENTYSIILPVTAKVTYDNNGVATIQL